MLQVLVYYEIWIKMFRLKTRLRWRLLQVLAIQLFDFVVWGVCLFVFPKRHILSDITQQLRKKHVQDHLVCASSPFYFCRIIWFNTYLVFRIRVMKLYFLTIVVLNILLFCCIFFFSCFCTLSALSCLPLPLHHLLVCFFFPSDTFRWWPYGNHSSSYTQAGFLAFQQKYSP